MYYALTVLQQKGNKFEKNTRPITTQTKDIMIKIKSLY